MQLCRFARANCEGPASLAGDVGPDSEFKIATLLLRVATYPSGARRRAGASGDRAIVIAGCDARGGRRVSIYAEDRDGLLGSRALDGERLSYEGLCYLQIGSQHSAFSSQSSHARARTTEKDRRAVGE